MRLPGWLKAKRYRQVGRSVEVTLEIDTSQFVAEMDRAAEGVRVMRYRQRLAHERSVDAGGRQIGAEGARGNE